MALLLMDQDRLLLLRCNTLDEGTLSQLDELATGLGQVTPESRSSLETRSYAQR